MNGYSVPLLADWNNNSLPDLIVGEQTPTGEGKIRIYLNEGTNSTPVFGSYTYAQTTTGDLAVPAEGCLGVFPRLFDWNGDSLKDLVLGLADGRIQIWLNVNTDVAPIFSESGYVQVEEPGSKVDINVGARATLDVVDWNDDGRLDLVVGALDGRVRVYLDEAAAGEPDFRLEFMVQDGSEDLTVPTGRSSPSVVDLNGDGRKDLVLGNTEGQILFYASRGMDAAPVFDGGQLIEAGGSVIDLAGTPRSRVFVGDYNGDGILDLLIGSADGRVLVALAETSPGPSEGERVVGRAGGAFTFTFAIMDVPILSGWTLTDDTGVDPNDKLTRDAAPELTFTFSEPVFGNSSDIIVVDPALQAVVPDSIIGWGTDTLTVTFTTALTLNGQYTVTLKGTTTIEDQSGNPLNGGADEVVRFVLDTVAPVTTVDTLTTSDATPRLTGTVDDPDASIDVTVGGDSYAATNNGDGTWTLVNDTIDPALAVGTYDVVVTATDMAGNAGTDSTSDELVITSAASPVYRFWSPTLNSHFYTLSESEKNWLITTWPHVWTYEGIAFYAYPEGSQPEGTSPVYRFWSPKLESHFYTMSEEEKDWLIATWPHVWTYEGIAWYAYQEGSQPQGAGPVYRFWSPVLENHFYTMSEAEKDWLIATWPHVWTYEGIAWYALPPAAAVPVTVDNLVSVSLGSTRYDLRTGQTSALMTVENTSSAAIEAPLWVVIESISDPAVTLAGSSGITTDGYLYVEFPLPSDDGLDPGESISTWLYFNNPLRRRFNFDYWIRGVI